MTTTTGDDDIDAEALQAQIDVSLTFTENLISSWIKSSEGITKLPSSRSRLNEERELEAYMRRPPRLGVGAAAPEASSALSRDTARLKHKLLANGSKKRQWEEDKGVLNIASTSDDEDESRVRVIKKKVRVDPFDKQGKSKKSLALGLKTGKPKEPKSPAQPARTDVQKNAPVTSVSKGAAKGGIDETSSPTKSKHMHRDNTGSSGTSSESSPQRAPSSSILSPQPPSTPIREGSPPSSDPQHTNDNPRRMIFVNSPSQTQKPKEKYPLVLPTVPESSITSLFVPPPIKGKPSSTPLLNLHGPPEAVDESASPKKKRKRKKKKKRAASEGVSGAVGEDDHDEDVQAD